MTFGFIIDLDGTLYAGTRPIPHAAAFIEALRANGWPFVLATNNSSRTPEEVGAHLEKVCGIHIDAHETVTTAMAAASYITGQAGPSRVYMIGEAGLRQALLDAGHEIVSDGDLLHPDDSGVRYVVQGIDRSFTYDKLHRASALIRSGARFILTNPDLELPSERGSQPGAGSIGAAIEAASGQAPVIIGKPSRIMMEFAAGRLQLPPDRIWVVGDNLRTDIGGGLAAGFRTALVLTGLARSDNVQKLVADSGIQPEWICPDLSDLLTRLQHVRYR